MLVPFSRAGDPSQSGELSALIASCRQELEAVRQDIAWNGGDRAHDDLQLRLARTTERLQSAISTVQRLERLHTLPVQDPAAPKEVREADHRLRNGLTAVISLLHRQAENSGDENVGDALRIARARIAVVAELHAQLGTLTGVQGEDREIALDLYIAGLVSAIAATHGPHRAGRVVRAVVAPIRVTPNTAQTIGLIVTELAVNALRHAFQPGCPGTVAIIGAHTDRAYSLTVVTERPVSPDLPDDWLPDSAGVRLVRTLARELGAELESCQSAAGARATLTLPNPSTPFGQGGFPCSLGTEGRQSS